MVYINGLLCMYIQRMVYINGLLCMYNPETEYDIVFELLSFQYFTI